MRCLYIEKIYKRSYLYEYVCVKMWIKPAITGYFVFRLRLEIAITEFLPLYKGRRQTYSFSIIVFRSILHQILKLHSFMILTIYKLCILGIIAVLQMLYIRNYSIYFLNCQLPHKTNVIFDLEKS